MAEFESEPRKVADIIKDLEGVLSALPDERRQQATKKQDLESEISGLTDEIADLIGNMKQTKDLRLPDALDDKTNTSMSAQAELEVLNGERQI